MANYKVPSHSSRQNLLRSRTPDSGHGKPPLLSTFQDNVTVSESLPKTIELVISSFSSEVTETFYMDDTWTAPTNVTSVFIEAFGSGSDGSGDPFSSGGGGYGGGGGAFVSGTFTVIPNVTYYLHVGAHGVTAGHTYFDDGTVLLAGGGNTGVGSTYVVNETIDGISHFGGNGFDGSSSTYGGGGGGAASDAGSGASAFDRRGASLYGGAGSYVGNSYVAVAGGVPGGGGGGGYWDGSANPGAIGGDGLLTITYTPTASNDTLTTSEDFSYDLTVGGIPSDNLTTSETFSPVWTIDKKPSDNLTTSENFQYILDSPNWTLVYRSVKGSPLSISELDANFNNLNNYKIERTSMSVVSASTINPNCSYSEYYITALSVAALMDTPSGTPVSGQTLLLKIIDDGTAHALTWTTSSGGYRMIGVTLPLTTIVNKIIYVGCIYNATDSYWDVVAVTS